MKNLIRLLRSAIWLLIGIREQVRGVRGKR
jgi:hypothetical protein